MAMAISSNPPSGIRWSARFHASSSSIQQQPIRRPVLPMRPLNSLRSTPSICHSHPVKPHHSSGTRPTPRMAVAAAARRGGSSMRGKDYMQFPDDEDDWASPSSRSSGSSSSSKQPSSNPVDVIKQELGLQSNRLDGAVRERVEKAIQQLGCRATAGEVAAKAGVKLSEAESALQALAYDSLAALQVSSEGDVVYAFPADFQSRIARKSLLTRARPLLAKVKDAAGYLMRVSFGSALIASVVVVYTALLVIMSSNKDDDRRRGGGMGMPVRVWFDATDLLWYWDPYYYRRTQAKIERGDELNFVEAIFSFVFGDGDPNANFDDARWRALGRRIQELGGVVTAEEMAPYLDPPQLKAQQQSTLGLGLADGDDGWGGGSTARRAGRGPGSAAAVQQGYADESFVLPALIRFGGEPVVDEEGGLVYKFPGLQASAGGAGAARQGARPGSSSGGGPVEERSWEFSAASPGQQLGVVLLGAVNIVGVLMLTSALASPANQYVLVRSGYGFVMGLMPALQAYAAAFATIPLVRSFLLGSRNAAIEARNAARQQAARLLQAASGVSGPVRDKMRAARALGQQRLVQQGDVVFDSGRGADQQLSELELEEFDRKLRGR